MGDDTSSAPPDGSVHGGSPGASAAGDSSVASADGDSPGFSLFGDSLGVVVFLSALALAGVTWQVGFFITDSYAVANALRNAAAGQITVERVYYSLTVGSQPGLHLVDGRVFARNYGQVVLALPVYYALDLVTDVADLGLLLAGGWCLLALAWCRAVGSAVGRRRGFTLAGCALALVTFAASVTRTTGVDADLTGVVALQAVSVLAVGVTALALYRLLSRLATPGVGAAAGLGAVVATPLWFWAAVPKRHVLTAAAVAVCLYWFAASRRPGPAVALPAVGRIRRAVALRAAGYLLAGLVCWVHVVEGAVLLGAFGAADLATASRTTRRTLLALALVTAVGLAPTLATNLLLTGDPAQSPRFAPSASAEDLSLGPGGVVSVDAGAGTSPAGSGAEGSVDTANGDGGQAGGEGEETSVDGGETSGEADRATDGEHSAGGSAVSAFGRAVRGGIPYAGRAVDAVGEAPARLYHTYVRSGRVDGIVDYGANDQETVDLSLLESVPLFGGLVGAALGVLVGLPAQFGSVRWRSLRRLGSVRWRSLRRLGSVGGVRDRLVAADETRVTAGFAGLVAVGFAGTYFPFLPLHSQLTVRYLLPAVPALVVVLATVPAVGGAVRTAPRALVTGYATAVLAGVAAVALGLPSLDLAVGEAMQLHGLANLAVAGGLATCVAVAVGRSGLGRGPAAVDQFGEGERPVGVGRERGLLAVALGVAGGAGTVLVLAMQFAYFEYGTYAVPAVRPLADALAVLS